MAISKSQIKYYLTNFRTRRSYFLFQIFQLIWSLIIIICAILSQNNFRETYILVMEFILLISLSVDLLFIRWISEGQLWSTRNNKIDCVILIVFTITFIFLIFTSGQDELQGSNKGSLQEQILETDDIILFSVIAIRYGLQIVQMVKTIKNTRKNMTIQRKMKDIDLNQQVGNSIIYDDHQIKQDQILRSKITQKHRESEKQIE